MSQRFPVESTRSAHAFEALRASLLSPLAIGLLTALCILGNRMRLIAGVQPEYGFMVTNLFLAWIPLTLAYAFAWAARSQLTRPALPLLVCAWILFLPNAPYLVTDVVHLHHHASVVNGLELALLAITGLLIAVKSVQLVHHVVEELWGSAAGWRAVQAIVVLAAAGVYVGRVLRWYSWTIILDPHKLGRILMRTPSEAGRVLLGLVGIALFAGAFYVVYRVLIGPRRDTLASPGHVTTP
jgi:uncharacterized membrane protein